MESNLKKLHETRARGKLDFKYTVSSSNPLLSLSKMYGVDYSVLLLYFDSMRDKRYDNKAHEIQAHRAFREWSVERGDHRQTELALSADLQQVLLKREGKPSAFDIPVKAT